MKIYTKGNNYPLYILFMVLFVVFISIEKVSILADVQQFKMIIVSFETFMQILLLSSIFAIYKKSAHNAKTITKWLLITSIGLLTNELSWFFFSYFDFLNKISLKNFFDVLNFTSFYIWVAAIILSLSKILKEQRVNLKRSIFIVTSFATINIVIIFLFISSTFNYHNSINVPNLLELVGLFVQLIVYDLVILSLIYARSRGFIIILFGILALISGDFFTNYALSTKLTTLSTYGILLWPLGLVFNWIGIILINKDKDFDTKLWIRSDSAIKSNLIFWHFIMTLSGFFIFLVIANALSLISREIFEAMPLFLIIYSVIVIIASLWLGNHFEEPFRKIENNIRVILDKVEPHNDDNDFKLEEFVFLQSFLTKAFYSLKEADAAKLREVEAIEEAKRLKLENEAVQKVMAEQEKFRGIVKQTLHDIQSPLSSIATIIEKYNMNLPENSRVTLKNAANRINDIANNLLNTYAKPDNNDKSSFPLIASIAILHLLSEKRYEFNHLPIDFTFNINNAAFTFITINQSSFKRALSNIINNAVDAVKLREHGYIKIDLNLNNNTLVIAIEDNGCGMPAHIKEKFFMNIAVTEGKEKGHGIGLTQISETINNFKGKCNIYISENQSTRFVIKFPITDTPSFIATEIALYENDLVLILDDDNSIHGAWIAKFQGIENINLKHFLLASEMLDFVKILDKQTNLVLLSDYELLNQSLNGIDAILQSKIKRSILVTSYVENPEIQRQVQENNILLLPKELTSLTPIKVNKKIAKFGKIVDLVWVEDQEWFSHDMISSYYADLKVDTYANPETFLTEVLQYPLDTRIILDTYYFTKENIPFVLDGFKLAEILHKYGYTKLILFSGEVITDRVIPDYLMVVLKNDAEKKSKLHLL